MQRIIEFISIQPLMVELGYTAFLVLLYVFEGMLFIVVLCCIVVLHEAKNGQQGSRFMLW